MAMRSAIALMLSLTAAAVTAAEEPVISTGCARIGEIAEVADGLMVKPLGVIEDSRCPKGAACIRAGTLQVRANLIELGRESPVTVVLGVPHKVVGGTLTLVDGTPHPDLAATGAARQPYRLHLAFTPGK